MTSAFTYPQSRANTGPLGADSDSFKTLWSSFSRRFQLSIFRDSGLRDVDTCSATGEVAPLRIPPEMQVLPQRHPVFCFVSAPYFNCISTSAINGRDWWAPHDFENMMSNVFVEATTTVSATTKEQLNMNVSYRQTDRRTDRHSEKMRPTEVSHRVACAFPRDHTVKRKCVGKNVSEKRE